MAMVPLWAPVTFLPTQSILLWALTIVNLLLSIFFAFLLRHKDGQEKQVSYVT
jgi:hypothetical protein